MPKKQPYSKLIFNGIKKVLGNKYYLTLFCLAIWMVFFDKNNYFNQTALNKKFKEIKSKLAYYDQASEEEQIRQEEVFGDELSLEKYAREQYLMKKDDEDIFLIEKVDQ